MRVALDVSAVPSKIAGVGRYVAELARRLPERGVVTTLVTRRDDAARWREISPSATVTGLVPNARAARLTYEAWVVGRSDAARHSDLWHGPHYTMPHRGVTPAVVTIHDLTFFTNPEWHERSKVAFFRRAISYSAQHARVLMTISEFSARLLDEIVPVHAPVVVTPLGVDLERFQPRGDDDATLFHDHQLSLEFPFIFFVGTFEPRKGLDVLLTAFEEIARQDGEVELWLAGQPGWGVGPLDSQLATHPFRQRVRRLGFVDEELLPALFRHARAVVYPSRGEGFGLPVIEAMACGASVVTTEGTVMAEVAGQSARLVPVGDAAALAASIAEVLDSSESDRDTWAQRARARAEHFTWEACVDQHLVAYQRALNVS